MSDEATIQIARVSTTGSADEIQVEILLDGGEKVLRVGMTLEDFAKAISGDFKVECRVSRRKGV